MSDSTSSSAQSAQSSPTAPAGGAQDETSHNLLIKQSSSNEETAGRYDAYIRELEMKINQVGTWPAS